MNDNSGEAPKTAKSKAEAETVNMKDGRLVDFAGKRRMIKESFVGDDGTISVRLDFRNGQTRTMVLQEALMKKYAAHGAEQKLGDETAGVDDVEDMILAIDDLIERLDKGEWTSRAEGSGIAGTSILLRALVEFTGKPIETIKAYLKTKSQKEKVALRNNKDVKPIIDRLEAEKASKGAQVDTGALLSELEGIG